MKRYLLLFIIFFFSLSIFGQDTLTVAEVKEASKKMDFKEMKTTWVMKNFKTKEIKETPNFEGASEFLKILAIGLVIIFALALLYFIFKDVNLRKTLIQSQEIQLDQIEDIAKIDFNALLKDALEKKDYRLATRIKFLMLLQLLQQRGKIVWKPNKTNRAYGVELADTSLGKPFQLLSAIFEKAWYGKNEVDAGHYESIQSQFESMAKMI